MGACNETVKRNPRVSAQPLINNNSMLPQYGINNPNNNFNQRVVPKPYNYPLGEKYFIQHREHEGYKGDIIGGKARVQISLGLKFTSTVLSSNPSAFKIGLLISMLSNKNTFQSLGTTLPMNNDKLTFETVFKVDYLFEEHQKLKFEIYYNNAPTEFVETTIGRIFGSYTKSVDFPLDKLSGTVLVVSISAIKEDTERTLIDFSFEPRIQSYSNYFVVISAFNMNIWQNVYKSKEQKLPKINTNSITLNDINNGDFDKQVQFELYEENKGIVGKIVTTLNEINKVKDMIVLDTGLNCPIYFQTQKEMKFIEYIQNGLQVSVMCAIDFTSSNKDPNLPISLHYMRGSEPNHYEQALRACCSIIAYYDYDQKFPVFGFGGNINGMVNHCFPCNLSQDANVSGVEGIIDAYKHSLANIRLDGPTYFSPCIKSMINSVQQALSQNVNSYFIFIILTDGDIHDMNETRDAIYEASFLPISFVIIGIGDYSFENMVTLDGDEIELTNTKGMKVERDIVQFVKYSNFKTDVNRLSQELLREIPGQVEMYFKKHKTYIQKNI
jgi:hypothetical protein